MSAFERQTDISVKVRSDDEAVLANQIAQEGSSSPADVFYAENTPPLQFLAGKHLLAPISPATLAEVDARYNSPAHEWVGVSARVDLMVYAKSKVPGRAAPEIGTGSRVTRVEGQDRDLAG